MNIEIINMNTEDIEINNDNNNNNQTPPPEPYVKFKNIDTYKSIKEPFISCIDDEIMFQHNKSSNRINDNDSIEHIMSPIYPYTYLFTIYSL